MTTNTHLLSVWNPSYAADAMDEHLDVLLDWARKRTEGAAEEDDVYVWWGKVKSENRQQPLPHVAEVLALDAQIDRGVETHLYLTDYRSLYVGHLGEITADDVRDDGEGDHVPAYYTERRFLTDFWFRLFDIRRLVADDTVAVVEELKRLRNTRYNDRPVSLYGGIHELPLIVTADAGTHWFKGRESLIEERLWAERDGRLRGETERLAADPVEYAKAIEVEVNRLLRPGLTLITDGHHQTLGALAHALKDPPPEFGKWLNGAFGARKSWWTGELAMRLDVIARLRNPGAHGESVSRALASSLRDETLGIGQEGLIVQLAKHAR